MQGAENTKSIFLPGVIKINSFGEKLRSEREKQGFDLEAVAEETKIRKLYLKALEEEHFSILPPRVYATGFVRRYAHFLNIDAEALVSEFQDLAYHGDHVQPGVVLNKEKSPRSFNFPLKNIMTAAIFLLIVLWAGNYWVTYIAKRGAAQPPAVHEPTVKQPTVKESNPIVQPANDKLVLDIEARQKCWLEVQVDGQQKFSAIMAVGEKQTFEGLQTITIKVGNAGGVDVSLNKKKLAPLGSAGEVVTKNYDISSLNKE